MKKPDKYEIMKEIMILENETNNSYTPIILGQFMEILSMTEFIFHNWDEKLDTAQNVTKHWQRCISQIYIATIR